MLAMIVASIAMGHLRLLALLAFGGAALGVLWRWPLAGVFLLLLFSTQNLMFVSMDNLPYWQVAGGLRVNMSDALLSALLALSFLRLIRRRVRPLFLTPMVLLAVLVAVVLGGGIALGTTNLDVGLGAARTMFAYAFYFVLVATMDTPTRVRAVIGMVFGIVLVAVAMQAWEAAVGQRLTLGLVESDYFRQTFYIDVQGRAVPYLWARAGGYLPVALFLSLGCALDGQRVKLFLPLAIVALAGLFFALVRQWFVYTALGFCAILVLQTLAGRVRLVWGSMTAIASLLIVAVLAIPWFTPLAILAARLQSIITFRREVNYLVRIDTLVIQLEHFRQSPLLGHGLSPRYLRLYSADVGFTNTLLLFGIVGLVAVIVLIVTVSVETYSQWRRMPASIERGLMLGLMGLLVMMVAGYAFGFDWFTSANGVWLVALVMAIVDRLAAQYQGVQLPLEEGWQNSE